MSIAYDSIVKRDIPYMYAVSADDLGAEDIFRLERVHHVEVKKFVLVKHARECIVLNKDLKNLKEIEEIIKKVMRSKYLPEKLLDRFAELTNIESSYILQKYFLDWKEEIRKRELNRQALSMLKSAKSLRVSWKVKRNKQIIKELFDIGFGIYEKKAVCDYQQGAENAFMYGYLLGVQSQKNNTSQDSKYKK